MARNFRAAELTGEAETTITQRGSHWFLQGGLAIYYYYYSPDIRQGYIAATLLPLFPHRTIPFKSSPCQQL